MALLNVLTNINGLYGSNEDHLLEPNSHGLQVFLYAILNAIYSLQPDCRLSDCTPSDKSGQPKTDSLDVDWWN